MRNEIPILFKPETNEVVFYPGSPQLRTTIHLSHRQSKAILELAKEANGMLPDKDRT